MSPGPLKPHQQVGTDHYWSRAYNTKERVCSFWHQVDATLGLGAATVLEVGPGSGVVTEWLRRAGLEVTTLDVDDALKPDVRGSVTDLPFPDKAFDAALCSQVLEHMRFDESERALAELARVVRTGVVVSVPDSTPWVGKSYPLYYGFYIDQRVRPRLPATRRALLRALLRREVRLRDWLFCRLVPARWGLGGAPFELSRAPIPHDTWQLPQGDVHLWELGAEGFPLARLLAAVDQAGLDLERTFRVPENPWHRFLIARPSPRPRG